MLSFCRVCYGLGGGLVGRKGCDRNSNSYYKKCRLARFIPETELSAEGGSYSVLYIEIEEQLLQILALSHSRGVAVVGAQCL